MKEILISLILFIYIQFSSFPIYSQEEIEQKKLYISKINFGTNVPERLQTSLVNRIKLVTIQRFGSRYRVISDKDIALMNQKAAQLMKQGCDETACMTQIADAIDADEIIYGDVFEDNGTIILSLTNLNRDKENFTLSSKSVVDLTFTEKQFDVYIKEVTYKLLDPKYKMNLNVVDYTDQDKKVRWDLVKRSAVLPGWGQYYYSEKFSAYLYGSLFAIGLLYNFNSYQPYLESKDKLLNDPIYFYSTFSRSNTVPNSSTSIMNYAFYSFSFSSNQKEYNRNYQNLSGSAAFVAGIYLINLFDALVFRQDRSLLTLDANREGWNIGIQLLSSSPLPFSSYDKNQFNLFYSWSLK